MLESVEVNGGAFLGVLLFDYGMVIVWQGHDLVWAIVLVPEFFTLGGVTL